MQPAAGGYDRRVMQGPQVSVVIASGAGGEFLFRCLAAVAPQTERAGAELIVVDRVGEAVRSRVSREYPSVRVLAASGSRPTIPSLRRAGLEAASGEFVAILEEHCRPPSTWLDTVHASVRSDDAAIGGPILDDGYRRTADWCVYFSEYHNYLPPWGDVDRYALNGANIVYHRARALAYRDVLDTGYWEVVLHPKLARDGRFRAVEALGVHHTGPFEYGYYLRQRYLLSRVWGGTQRGLVPASKRALHLLLGPIFPLLLFARVTSRVLASPRFLAPYLRALPWLVPAWCVYAAGEWLGYLAGPGRALEEVE
jgi:glycosyltransferase involved in cell wall biosynthesis